MNKELLQSLKIAVGCLKSGIKDPEIIADLEKTIHKGELRELFVEECRKGLKMVTLTEQMKVVKSEIERRKREFPRYVESGKITQLEANYQIEAMEYVVNTLQAVLDFERSFIVKNQKLFQ